LLARLHRQTIHMGTGSGQTKECLSIALRKEKKESKVVST